MEMLQNKIKGKKESMMLKKIFRSRILKVMDTIEETQILNRIPTTIINHLSLTTNHYNRA
jgi:hypothetical protein